MAKIGSLVFKTEKNFQILAGSASFMYPAMAVGMGDVSFLLIKLVFTHFVWVFKVLKIIFHAVRWSVRKFI